MESYNPVVLKYVLLSPAHRMLSRFLIRPKTRIYILSIKILSSLSTVKKLELKVIETKNSMKAWKINSILWSELLFEEIKKIN